LAIGPIMVTSGQKAKNRACIRLVFPILGMYRIRYTSRRLSNGSAVTNSEKQP
jgi:hypothetical protein